MRPRRAVRRTIPVLRTVLAATTVAALLAGATAWPATAGPSASELLPGSNRLPNGWGLTPAGTEVLTNRGTTGVAVSPDGTSVYATTSGIFDQAVVYIDASTLVPTTTLVSSAYQGVAADQAGNVWVSGGPADAVFQFKQAGPALVDARQAGVAPDTPNNGIPVTAYPGDMLLAGTKLFVAGNLSVPSSVVASVDPGGSCASSDICSVVNVLDVSNPDAQSPAVHAIPVGRDAFGLAYRLQSSTLYVANWADATNPARSGGAGTGTVSVVKVNADGSGSEEQVVPVGKGPTGLALSPDGTGLVVANSDSDSLSVLSVDPATGLATVSQTVSVAAAPGAPLGTSPIGVAFSPDGRYLFATLAGLNAVEVFSVAGGVVSPIRQTVTATFGGRSYAGVKVPGTFIPTGWYPDALALGPEPSGAPGERLYVANLRGDGAGPGYYGQTEVLVGSSTEGSVSAIDLPADRTALSRSLATWTTQVVNDDQLAPLYMRSIPDPAADACLPAPLPGGGTASSAVLCAVQRGRINPHTLHVVIIEAENKTFDSYFGDTGTYFSNVDASPAYTEYGDAVTTNQHDLAESYTVDDNFWNEGAESSVLGHSWLSGAYSTVDNELTWGSEYDQGLRGNRGGGQYGPSLFLSGASSPAVAAQESIMYSPRNLLIDEAQQAGLGVRLFGTDTRPGSPAVAAGDQVPQQFWGEHGSSVDNGPFFSDLAWPDVDRAGMFLNGSTISHGWNLLNGPPPSQFGQTISFSPADDQRFTLDGPGGWTDAYKACAGGGGTDAWCQSSMPNLVYMELPENHTYDVSDILNPLDPTPQSMVADNDYAIGEVVQGLAHSPFWKNTIVFVTEDDNQFTGDHVDIHRTFLLTTGGLARRLGSQGLVATQVGSFPSIDKTTEVLLGLKPLTLFDARAVPLQEVVADSTGADPCSSNQQSCYTAVYPPTPFLSGPTDGTGIP